MTNLGFICGTGYDDWDEFEVIEEIDVITPWGTPSSPLIKGELAGKKMFLLLRHGKHRNIPPHRINHRANIYALQREVDEIVGTSSAGALEPSIDIPSISIPEDYINLADVPTYFDDEIKHITPNLSEDLRRGLIDASEGVNGLGITYDDHVYIQTAGPRLETKAEVRMISDWGDLVGMTMASEATLSKEADIGYASIVSIDNYANGIVDEELDFEEIIANARRNWNLVKELVENFMENR